MAYNLFWGDERRRSLTSGEKNLLIRLARGKCEYCGKDIIGKGITPNIHHIVPFASRGSDLGHNLIVLCPDCHSMVEQIPKEKLRAKIRYRLLKKAPSLAENVTPKKTTTKKTAAKKATAKKTTARKTTARKTAAKKATAKKTTARKTTARKTTARKTTARKTATRKRS